MIEALELPRAILVAHSMGGFVAVVTAHLYPDRSSRILLIDGGLPLAIPAGISKEDLLQATLGPAAARLSMTGLFKPSEIERWRAELPALTLGEVPDVNHYTIIMSVAGARAVARELHRL